MISLEEDTFMNNELLFCKLIKLDMVSISSPLFTAAFFYNGEQRFQALHDVEIVYRNMYITKDGVLRVGIDTTVEVFRYALSDDHIDLYRRFKKDDLLNILKNMINGVVVGKDYIV